MIRYFLPPQGAPDQQVNRVPLGGPAHRDRTAIRDGTAMTVQTDQQVDPEQWAPQERKVLLEHPEHKGVPVMMERMVRTVIPVMTVSESSAPQQTPHPGKHEGSNAILMLDQRRRRWANIKIALVRSVLFVGIFTLYISLFLVRQHRVSSVQYYVS